VADYIRCCERCQKTSARFDKAAPALHSIPVPNHPWKQIGIDLCSLPKSEDGHVAIVVAVDYFSKWVEAEAIKDKTADTVADFLYQLICRHGCYDIQINDQGREFVNQVSTTLHQLTGVKQHISSAYHPQSNGLTERNNRTIQSSMLRILGSTEDQWVKVLPGLLFAYRTSVQKSTGFTPFYLMYGRQAKLPLEFEASDDVTTADTVAEMIIDESIDNDVQTRLSAINHLRSAVSKSVSENIVRAQDRQKRDYQKRHLKKTPFAQGDDVLLWNLRRADRKGGKMQSPWLGPYKIGRVCGKGTYELVNEEGATLQKKANGANLKMFVKPNTSVYGDSNGVISSNGHDDEVEVTGVEVEETFSFRPTTAAWRKRQCAKLNLPPPQRLPKRLNKAKLGVPVKVNSTAGDGNCFFRTVSYELCGSAEYHAQVRDAIVTFMSSGDNAKMFHDYTTKAVATYLSETHMNEAGTWATDVEIVAAATLLQTAIYVYSDVNNPRKWYKHKPLLQGVGSQCSENMYITNLRNHFERVVSVD